MSDSASTIYNSLLDPTLTVPTSVGGISSGTTVASLTGKTLVGIIDDLLFPTVLPTYTIPTITLSSSVTGSFEVGVTVNPILTLDGTKNDASGYTLLNILKNAVALSSTTTPTITSATNIANQFGYSDPNNPNYKYTFVYTDSGLVIPATVNTSASSTIYSSNGSYLSGLVKKNNKGVDDSRTYAVRSTTAPQSGSTGFAASTITLSGWYPYFYGKTAISASASDIVTIIQSGAGFTKVVATGAGTLTMAFNATGEWPWFAIFNPFTTKVTWYENALNNGSIGGATDLFSAPTTLSVNSPSGYWSGINFKIYVAQKVTTLGSCQIS